MMAAKKKRRKTTKRKTSSKKSTGFFARYWVNITGIIIILLAISGLFSAGMVGAFVVNCVRFFLGSLYVVGLIGVLAVGIALAGFSKVPAIPVRIWSGTLLLLLGITLWLTLIQYTSAPQPVNFVTANWEKLLDDVNSANVNSDIGGGIIAAALFAGIKLLLGKIGVGIISSLLILVGLFVLFNVSASKAFLAIKESVVFCGLSLKKFFNLGKSAGQTAKQKLASKQHQQSTPVAQETSSMPVGDDQHDDAPFSPADITVSGMAVADKKPVEDKQPEKKKKSKNTPEIDEPKHEVQLVDVQEDDNYKLPTPDLLTKIDQNDQSAELKSIDKNAKILQETLNSFGVKAQIKHVSLGPSVTKYELHPDIGVKVSRIVNLADDIALALAAKDIRIEAPIPGKSLIGIEVPNRQIATVSFRDVVEASPDNHGHLLQVPLGKDVNGNVITADLTKMPHLLIAGSTGSGKSVAINGIITSILLNAKPSQVKLMLIDPKKVELGVYNGIPHLLSPVVSEPKKAARALQKVVSEMENRYELFAKYGQRKISTYNEFVAKNNQQNDVKLQPMPYIVVIVDELADLMMTVSNDVEAAIIRLAQMGRAAGIHMILATQRPSVDVITGLIKANVPSRIAFAVSSGIDSRTIIDTNGAEKLLGRGDMLFLPIDSNTPVRVQGAFIPDKDVSTVVDFITDQASAEYDESMMVSDEEIKEEDQSDSDDDLFNDALEFVVDQQKASTSLLQRHFRIGYNRAARLIDDLEQRGYIGPQDGSRPRQVFKQKPE